MMNICAQLSSWLVRGPEEKRPMSKVLIFGATPFSLINFRGDLLKKLTKEGHTVYGLSGIDKGFHKPKFQEFGVEHHHVFLKYQHQFICELYYC